ncbi:MAG: Vps23 core domain [Idiomarinaceae bacterium HL-53]|nr:MAG: Vps23 core domain [Idiomarinaceae bacterium HL-53]CUS47751.1 hypothetical protein Ga0003345_0685 [Idiomarinaceae bacterium HL-53]
MALRTHIVYLIIIIGILGAWIVLGPADKREITEISEPALRVETPTFEEGSFASELDLAEQILQLEAQNRALQDALGALQQEFASLQEQQALRTENTDTAAVAEDLSIEELTQDQLQRAEYDFIDVTNLDEQLATEPVDSSWAYEMETNIRDLIITSNDLANLYLKDIQCRTTICVVDFDVQDSESGFDTHKFHLALREQELFSFEDYSYVTMYDTNNGTAKWIMQKRNAD